MTTAASTTGVGISRLGPSQLFHRGPDKLNKRVSETNTLGDPYRYIVTLTTQSNDLF